MSSLFKQDSLSRRIFQDDASSNVSTHDGERLGTVESPYSTEFLLQFCQEVWPQWVKQTRHTLELVQDEMIYWPSRQLTDTAIGLEQLLQALVKVC